MIRRLITIGGIIAGVFTAVWDLLSRRSVEARQDQAEGACWWRRLLKLAALLAALAFGGLLVATSGIIPIKASSGHWPITAWFLHFSMQRSVATHTLGLTAPALDEPSYVLKGAGHYETGCAPCHGSPTLSLPRIPQRMTPPPPHLAQTISMWEAEELFYIVKHGVKFTGMPAWPAQQRDDEVWALVAFLRKLPGLDAESYQRLVHGEASAHSAVPPFAGLLPPEQVPRAVSESCARCHGVDGHGRESAFPKLAGQRFDYLFASLQAFARGERQSGMMEPIAASFSLEELRELARYYSSLEVKRPAPPRPELTSNIQRGETIAQRGIPSQHVPACAACHGPNGVNRNSFYPELAGQHTDYLVLHLTLFKQGYRGGTAYAHLMRPVVESLTAEQMRDVALFYAWPQGSATGVTSN